MFKQQEYPTNAKQIIMGMAREILKAKDTTRMGNNLTTGEILVRWQRPKEGYCKLNTDGSYKTDTKQASAGGV